MAKGQRQRKTKVSKGIHGGGGKFQGLTAVQLVLMGQGMAHTASKKKK